MLREVSPNSTDDGGKFNDRGAFTIPPAAGVTPNLCSRAKFLLRNSEAPDDQIKGGRADCAAMSER